VDFFEELADSGKCRQVDRNVRYVSLDRVIAVAARSSIKEFGFLPRWSPGLAANRNTSLQRATAKCHPALVHRRLKTAGRMAIDTGHHRLFSGYRSGVMAVSDYQAGKVVASVPIGKGVDGAGYDADLANAFASNADGTLTVIHQDTPDQYHVAEN
jgi:hypothetical protein